MAINNFPYTDLNSLNLDWVIKRISELEESSGAAEIAELKAAVEAVQAELEAAQDAVVREIIEKQLVVIKRKLLPLTGLIRGLETRDRANGIRISGTDEFSVTIRINDRRVTFYTLDSGTVTANALRVRYIDGYSIGTNRLSQCKNAVYDADVASYKVYADNALVFSSGSGLTIDSVFAVNDQFATMDFVFQTNANNYIVYHLGIDGLTIYRTFASYEPANINGAAWTDVIKTDTLQISSNQNNRTFILTNSVNTDNLSVTHLNM